MNSDKDIVLYSYWRSSCSWRVRIALELKGIPFEYRPINLLKSEQKTASYLEVNPAGLVPTLIVQFRDGREPVVICQSISIMEYLEEAFPSSTPSLLPRDPIARAFVRTLVQTIASDTQPLQNLRVLCQLGDEPAKTTWAHRVIAEGLAVFETILGQTAGIYSAGNELTLADIVLIPQVYNAKRFNVDTSQFPRITAICKRLEDLPAFKRAHPSAQPDCPNKPS